MTMMMLGHECFSTNQDKEKTNERKGENAESAAATFLSTSVETKLGQGREEKSR
jgi:hypothetical protein